MAHPRFGNLPRERQQQILSVATEAFAEHGFEAASYNRIIEAAGISKGSAYYYFEGKEDLYLTVLEETLDALASKLEDWEEPADAEDYWRRLRKTYFALIDSVMGDERSGRLLRGLSHAHSNPKLQRASGRLEAPIAGWFARVLGQGRKLGAVRTDVPEDLLLAAILGVGQATDFWLLKQWEEKGSKALRSSARKVFSLFESLAMKRPR